MSGYNYEETVDTFAELLFCYKSIGCDFYSNKIVLAQTYSGITPK